MISIAKKIRSFRKHHHKKRRSKSKHIDDSGPCSSTTKKGNDILSNSFIPERNPQLLFRVINLSIPIKRLLTSANTQIELIQEPPLMKPYIIE